MDRAIEARDRVLTQMVENNYATEDQAAAAKKVPVHSSAAASTAAPRPTLWTW